MYKCILGNYLQSKVIKGKNEGNHREPREIMHFQEVKRVALPSPLCPLASEIPPNPPLEKGGEGGISGRRVRLGKPHIFGCGCAALCSSVSR